MLPHQNAIDENVQGRKGGDHGWSCAAAQECTAAGDPRDPQNASVLGCDPALREQTASGGQVKAAAPPLNVDQKTDKVNWFTAVVMVLFHIGAIAALFFFRWKYLALAAALYWIAVGFGIGMGYHRLHTHRSYKTPKWLEYFFAICGTLTLEGGPIFWVATHRIHHQNSDHAGDPHTPRDGGLWAHVGWIIFGEVHHNKTALLARYAPDLARDRFYVLLNRYHYVPLIVLGLTLLAFGGWPLVLWGVCLRVVIGLHATWLVNSATHMWGTRRFSTRDDSRNNWWVALLTFGEGWHNNHHAHPTSARHGLAWYELDITWLQIRVLQLVGLVRSPKTPKLSDTHRELARGAAS